MSCHLPADSGDMKLYEKSNDSESDEDGCLQFFVSSAAADTPLMGPLLAGQPAGGGLETTAIGDGDASSCSTDIDFTAVVSPSKVSSVNTTNTEFLLIGEIRRKNQLAKIHNSSLDTCYSARNLGFIFH